MAWVEDSAGSGLGTVSKATRVEYRRLLITFAPAYFPTETRMAELDRAALRGFVSWLAGNRGGRGRLADRSIASAVVPLRLCLAHGEEEGVVTAELTSALVLPGRRKGRDLEDRRTRFLTRSQLGALLAEIPSEWVCFFSLLASTGLRISEAIALRGMDFELSAPAHLWVRRAIVGGVVKTPKSRFGIRRIPLEAGFVEQLRWRCGSGTEEGDLQDFLQPLDLAKFL